MLLYYRKTEVNRMELLHKIEYRLLKEEELTPGLLADFERDQEVTRVWSPVDGKLTLIENPFREEWTEKQKDELVVTYFPNAIHSGGCVVAALDKGTVIAFAVLEGGLFGKGKQYIQLASIHVSLAFRGMGIGRHLFSLISGEARKRGAEKLYISSHYAEETQAFYKAVGCVPAKETFDGLASCEPNDIPLEFLLNP